MVDTGESWGCCYSVVYERCHRPREKRPPTLSSSAPLFYRCHETSIGQIDRIFADIHACLSSAAGSPLQPGGAAVAGRKTLVLALGCLAGAVLVTTYTG